MSRVLCSISTKGRYDTTLSMAIQSVINQTRKIDHLVIFDDNDEDKVKDLREIQVYKYLFSIMDLKGISWQVNYGKRLGQHHNHQVANTMGFEWVWRVDDDCVPEPHVLDTLMRHTSPTVGAVGGSILTPPFAPVTDSTGRIEDIYEPSIQWDYIKETKEVDHLHCSFIYRAGIVDYNLALSKVAFREETLFTYGLKQRGYQLFVVPDANTWHLKNQYGGVRTETKEMFEHDDWIFHNYMKYKSNTIVILDSGLGDHIVFKHVLAEIKNPIVFSCWPDIVPGESIGEAHRLFGNIDQYNIYGKMDQWKWTGSLEDAFRKMYVWEMP
jgi:glycosyltransferase involved in cell wall biosynthesis